ncbi:hypothetical protein FRC11_013296, partial [Ceratobasidium sp. 423]
TVDDANSGDVSPDGFANHSWAKRQKELLISKYVRRSTDETGTGDASLAGISNKPIVKREKEPLQYEV